MQDRFRLIIGRVGNDDKPGSMLSGHVNEKILPQSPRPPLDPLSSHTIGRTHSQIANGAGDPEPCGQVGHEVGIGRCLFP
jgi:hypothetical protein